MSSDTDSVRDIYQRFNGVTTRISAAVNNVSGAFDAFFFDASADGTRVFFTTDERLVSADTDGLADIYQRFNGLTTRISAGAINGNGAFDALFFGASADGTRGLLRHRREAGGLRHGQRRRHLPALQRCDDTDISGAINGNGAFDAIFSGASADGTRVFFSTAERLVGSDTDNFWDVYERFNGVTTRITAGAINGNGAFDTNFRGASADGTSVFFNTDEQLVASDTDNVRDVYGAYDIP